MAGKILGAVLIIGACFAAGYRLSIREVLRLRELLFFRNVIEGIVSETEHNRSAFIDALKRVKGDSENEILSAVENALINNNSVKTAWKFAFEENKGSSYMKDEDIKRLEEAGDAFNSGDISLWKSKAEDIARYVCQQENAIKSRIEKDKRVYRSVSISIGLFIVIILL